MGRTDEKRRGEREVGIKVSSLLDNWLGRFWFVLVEDDRIFSKKGLGISTSRSKNICFLLLPHHLHHLHHRLHHQLSSLILHFPYSPIVILGPLNPKEKGFSHLLR